MGMISSLLLTEKDSSLSTMLYTVITQFSTFNTPNLWKTINNHVLIAQINIRLLCIRLFNSITNRRVIRVINVIFCSDLGEQIITRTPFNCQPLVITLHTHSFIHIRT